MKTMLICLLAASACSQFNQQVGLKDDGPLEQGLEQQIKEETGIIIDFTPEEKTPAPENKGVNVSISGDEGEKDTDVFPAA